MATQVKWTPQAQTDLVHIYQFIAEDSVTYAAQFVNGLIRSVEKQLKTFPLSGRRIPELESSPLHYLREVIFKNYRVIYNPSDAPMEIRILAVHSSRMDILGQAESWIL